MPRKEAAVERTEEFRKADEPAEAFRKPHERVDDLQRSNLRILQDPERFCFGMDAVLLSGFVTVKRGEKVTDLCTGTGIIPLLLSAKTEASEIDGIEIQPDMADMARRSVEMNGLTERVRIICGDLREAGAAGERESRDVVTCNPPYMAAGSGIVNPEDVQALARHEVTCTLEDAVRETARLLKNGGRTAWIYRPNRLSELFSCFRRFRLEPKRLKFVHPYLDREANMVLVEAVKGGGSFLKVEAPLLVFGDDGEYRPEIREIYGY
ncbi:MAG: tRNA1(Val) (adenine(37)-N6)-methyltransferase [Stomatobaculum sp.]|nr:tRNA1(Val) (adenine(37)-N6)-methyltransferase [Stomatobaculum sp.]